MARTIGELLLGLEHGTIPHEEPDFCIPCLYREARGDRRLHAVFAEWVGEIITHMPLRHRGRLPEDMDRDDTLRRHLGVCLGEVDAIATSPHPHVGWRARMLPKVFFWQCCARHLSRRQVWSQLPVHHEARLIYKKLLAEGRSMPRASTVFGR